MSKSHNKKDAPGMRLNNTQTILEITTQDNARMATSPITYLATISVITVYKAI
jgi:hypothetical protein